ncbi:MAG: hypothetical protein AAFN30_04700 [Actinomycetota bacterium]
MGEATAASAGSDPAVAPAVARSPASGSEVARGWPLVAGDGEVVTLGPAGLAGWRRGANTRVVVGADVSGGSEAAAPATVVVGAWVAPVVVGRLVVVEALVAGSVVAASVDVVVGRVVVVVSRVVVGWRVVVGRVAVVVGRVVVGRRVVVVSRVVVVVGAVVVVVASVVVVVVVGAVVVVVGCVVVVVGSVVVVVDSVVVVVGSVVVVGAVVVGSGTMTSWPGRGSTMAAAGDATNSHTATTIAMAGAPACRTLLLQPIALPSNTVRLRLLP